MYKSVHWVAAAFLSAGIAGNALAIPPGAGYYTINWGTDNVQRPGWKRCAALLTPFDKFAQGGHFESSDGPHNLFRLGAEIACEKGDCERCTTTMERLLTNKRIGAPPVSPAEVESH